MDVLAINKRLNVVLLGAAYPATELLPTAQLQRNFGRIGRHQSHLLATEGYADHNYPEIVPLDCVPFVIRPSLWTSLKGLQNLFIPGQS